MCFSGGDHKEGDIRLVGGSYQWQGRVEIYLYGEWGTITDDGAGNYDAHVVCWQLGYDTRGEGYSKALELSMTIVSFHKTVQPH